MPTIDDITALVAEAEGRLGEAREMAVGAQNALKEYNIKRDGGLDAELFQETIGHIDKARRAGSKRRPPERKVCRQMPPFVFIILPAGRPEPNKG